MSSPEHAPVKSRTTAGPGRRDITRTILYTFALLTTMLLAACGGRVSQQVSDSNVTIDLVAQSLEVGPTVLQITVTGEDGQPLDNVSFNVKGDMTHAGMVPVLAESDGNGEQGVYHIPFEWTMAGDWIVTVDAALPDGQTISQQFDFTVSGEAGSSEEHHH